MENSLAPTSAAVKGEAFFYALSVSFVESCDSWQKQDVFSTRSPFPAWSNIIFCSLIQMLQLASHPFVHCFVYQHSRQGSEAPAGDVGVLRHNV